MPEFNYPEPTDPDFNSKALSLLKQLFEHKENPIQNFPPIQNPDTNQTIGSIWYHNETGKFKVQTAEGIKTLKFE